MGRKLRRSIYSQHVVCGKRTLKSGEAAQVINMFGRQSIAEGPCVVRLFNSSISFLDRAIASSTQYLRIILKENTKSSVKHVRGPCSCFILPSHQEIQVKDLILLREQDVLRRRTIYGESFIRGPLLYMPEVIDECLEILKNQPNQNIPIKQTLIYQKLFHEITTSSAINAIPMTDVVYKANAHQYIRIIHKDKRIEHIRGPYQTAPSAASIESVQLLDLVHLKEGDELYRLNSSTVAGSTFIKGPCEYMPEITDECGMVYRNGIKYMTVFFFDEINSKDLVAHENKKNRQMEFYRNDQLNRLGIRATSAKSMRDRGGHGQLVAFKESNQKKEGPCSERNSVSYDPNSTTSHMLSNSAEQASVHKIFYHRGPQIKKANSFDMDLPSSSLGRAKQIYMFD